MTKKNVPTKPNQLHKALGVIGFFAFITLLFLDFFVADHQLRFVTASLLFVAFMTLLGFGHIVADASDLYRGGK